MSAVTKGRCSAVYTMLGQSNGQDKDDARESWAAEIAEQWADELSDVRQEIYTLADGEPVRES